MSVSMIGKVALTPKGEYKSATSYERLDVISYQGSSYVVLKNDIIGIEPIDDKINYQLLAQSGADGQPGRDGVDGQPGATGKNATINGVNTLTIQPGKNISLDQKDDILTITGTVEEVGPAYISSEQPPEDKTKIWVDPNGECPGGGGGNADIDLGVSGAKVGQIIEIEAVDTAGKPTKWKAADKPAGGGSANIDLGITGASVGQFIQIKAVGPDGKPTQWEAVAKPKEIGIVQETGDSTTAVMSQKSTTDELVPLQRKATAIKAIGEWTEKEKAHVYEYKDYNPSTNDKFVSEGYTVITSGLVGKPFQCIKYQSNQYFDFQGSPNGKSHGVPEYSKSGCIIMPAKPIPEGMVKVFIGILKGDISTAGKISIGHVWFLNDNGIVVKESQVKRTELDPNTQKSSFTLDGIPVQSDTIPNENVEGVIIDIPKEATMVITGDYASSYAAYTRRTIFWFISRTGSYEGFETNGLKVAPKDIVGFPEEEDLSYLNLVEIPFNPLTDYLKPEGEITASTTLRTKKIPFDAEVLRAKNLFIISTNSISTSTLPHAEFFDENGKSLGSTTGVNYLKEKLSCIKGVYGVLREIPTGTKSIQYRVNKRTMFYPKIMYTVASNKVVKVPKITNFTNDKVYIFGDSIIGNFTEDSFAGASVPHMMTRLLNTEITNCGFGGCTMTDRPDDYKVYSMTYLSDAITSGDFTEQDRVISEGKAVPSNAKEHMASLKATDFNTVNTIVIAYGINDYHQKSDKIGALNKDIYAPLSSYDRNTYIGAAQYVIKKLQTAYPNLQIVLSSIKRNFVNNNLAEYNLRSEFPSVGENHKFYFALDEWKTYIWKNGAYIPYDGTNEYFFRDEEQYPPSTGVHISEWVKALKEVADFYGIRFIDNYNLGITTYNAPKYYQYPDGTHPNQFGRYKLAYNIANNLILE